MILLVGILCSTPLPLKIWDRIKDNTFIKVVVVGLLLVLCIAYIVASTSSPFLYYRF